MNKRFGNFIPKVFFASLLLISSAAMAQRAEDQHVSVGGNVFGGGKKANVGGSSTVLIDQTGAIVGIDVYGGGEEAKVNTIDGTTLTAGKSTTVTLRKGDVSGNLYGGGLGVRPTSDEDLGTPADVLGPVQVTINGGTVEGHVFGCNNLYGAPKSTVNVDVIKDPNNVVMNLQQNVYGGGNLAAYAAPTGNLDYPEVNIKHGLVNGNVFGGGLGLTAEVTGNPQVTIGDDNDSHTAIVNGKVYGGGDEAVVRGSTTVTLQNAHSQVGVDVYGGGNQADVSNSTTVHIYDGTIGQDVYGGGAFAHVGTNANDNTTVNVLGGTVTRDVYGGGLGRKEEGQQGETGYVEPIAAAVNGVVTVNIGALTGDLDDNGFAPSASVSGNATIGGSVFGCNNSNGTPKDDVTVHIYKTARTTGVNTVEDQGFAIAQVFGGGNQAHYQPTATGKKATVHVWTCDNTIQYLYGGGNAADVGTSGTGNIQSATDVIIDGGRIEWVFGGGNGAGQTNPGANIFGNVGVSYHAGKITYLFGGSNEKGDITGSKTVSVLNDGPCTENEITELYGGSNLAPLSGDINLTMSCHDHSDNCLIGSIFGGSRNANVAGDVTLTIEGGLYNYAFGGNNIGGTINGNVTLNLYGGTINEAAFGGNKGGGSITGDITVNVEDHCACPLQVKDVFGAGDQAMYTAPTGEGAREYNPIVYVNNLCTVEGTPHTITGNVYGGGNGDPTDEDQEPGMVTGNPQVIVGDLTTGHESYRAAISGNVYGGGNAAKVVGTTTVLMQKDNSTVGLDIYGGGNLAHVSGSTVVDIDGGTVSQDVYGGGALANTGGSTVTLDGGNVRDIYGGGLGRNAASGVNAIEAQVTGAVQVTVNGGTVTNVFGCNNFNGAPTSTVRVDINNNVTRNVYGGGNQASCGVSPAVYINEGTVGGSVFGGGLGTTATVAGEPSVTIGDLTEGHSSYQAIVTGDVYGGGDMADVKGTTTVLVQKCNTLINGDVYGGGNAADVEKNGSVGGTTSVTVTGGTITGTGHGMVFGGGHGDKDASPAVSANVATSTSVEIKGGTIYQVYGGSNSMGTINGGNSGGINVLVNKASDACELHINEVYGGGNYAASQAGSIDIQCTGTVENANEGINYVYGGANRANVTGPIELTIDEGRIDYVFGGNNNSGSITGDITVNIEKKANPCVWEIGDVFGGGNLAEYSGTPDVNIKNGTVSGSVFGGGNEAGVGGGDVSMTGGAVLGSLYGGCNTSGVVDGAINVEVKGGTMGSSERLDAGTLSNVFGGGFGESTSTKGNVTVTITRASGDDAPAAPTIYGDVYGGSAFGSVNDDGSDETKVYILDGILETKEGTENGFPSYTGGNVYGGGLGEAGDANVAKGQVNGKVFVNIGSGVMDTQDPRFTSETSGNATIKGNIYGCNNTNGSPQQDVVVNVYKTHHTQGQDDIESLGYALHNVFGGGNKANFMVEGKTPTVNIYGCDNTIERTFGGSNAAASNTVTTMIQGGHIHEAYGGGNGEVTAADIHGDVNLNIHGGRVDQSFGGSNRQGNISGHSFVTIDGAGCGGETEVEEFFCGGNFADYEGDIDATIQCADGLYIHNLYGGCKQADVLPSGEQIGNVHLKVYGGTYDNIFGGSQGRRPGTNGTGDQGESADINGSILLEIYGGKVNNAIYGGSHILGKVKGTITVNIENGNSECELDLSVTDVYGGGNEADYDTAPTTGTNEYPYTHPNYPVINIKNATVRNVFGGGYKAKVMGNPQIHLKKGAKVLGNVYGGGNMGEVTDSPTTTMVEGKPKVNIDGKDTTPNPHVIGQPHDE